MKKIILLSVTMFALAITSVAQTTLEEYNYVTKGYKAQVVDQGGDMKKGYVLEDVDKQTTAVRSAELKVLYRVKDTKKEIAAYMIVYKKESNPKEYICIPNPNSVEEVTTKYWTQLYDGSSTNATERLQLITYLLSRKMKW